MCVICFCRSPGMRECFFFGICCLELYLDKARAQRHVDQTKHGTGKVRAECPVTSSTDVFRQNSKCSSKRLLCTD